MAKSRYINTRFWDDTYISSLDPIEKLLFVYFLTNPCTEISGAYEIQLKRVALDTGIDRDMVQKILNRFADEDKIIYRDGWIFICNFIKHQSDSEKINIGIAKLVSRCPDWIKDRVSIEYGYRIDIASYSILLDSNLNQDTIREAWTGKPREEKAEPPNRPSSPESNQPAAEIFVGTVLAGVTKELGFTKFAVSAQRDWTNYATLAFENNFTAEQFLECMRLLRGQTWRTSAVKPATVFENLPELPKLRREGKQNGTTERLPTLAEKLADDQANRQNLRKAPTTV